MSAADAPQRFWKQTDTTGECWRWLGGKTISGYGQLSVHYRKVLAHRFAYELLVAPIPEGMEIDHLCHERDCVNPAHMEVVTHAENVRRTRPKPYCPQGHAMTGANVAMRADTGHRICRQCRVERNRKAYQRRKATATP